MKERYNVFGLYQSGELKVTHEWRPPRFEGPQLACHPRSVELSVVSRGSSQGQNGNRPETLHRGLYGVIPAGVEHSSWAKDSGAEEINIHLPVELLERATVDAGFELPIVATPGVYYLPPLASDLVSALARAVSSPETPARELMIESLFLALSSWFIDENRGRKVTDEGRVGSGLRQRIRIVEELMRTAPERKYSIDELAEVAGMSRFRFMRAFKKELGVSPYSFLLSRRVERGADLVSNTELSLTTIAFELGFSSSGRFTEAFKRAYGRTPSAVRRNSPSTIRKKSLIICEAQSGRSSYSTATSSA